MGVHGNGLTALIWMQPSSQATVMEFFYPGGFVYDYESTARLLGIKHYGFWGNESDTFKFFMLELILIFCADISPSPTSPLNPIFLMDFTQTTFRSTVN